MPDIQILPGIHLPEKSFRFRTSRSSGPGGQNVNKLDTRVELVIEIEGIVGLPENMIEKVRRKLAPRTDTRGRTHFVSQRYRSQGQNRDDVVEMAVSEIRDALEPEKERRATAPTKASVGRRLDAKKKRSGTKRGRKPPAPEDE